MTRHVSSLVQALDAAIAGEPGHVVVNRIVMLHERARARDEAETIEYWTLRGRTARAVDAGAPGEGDNHVSELLRLLDSLEQTRGVEMTRDLREHEKDLFWVLRSRIARDVGEHAPDTERFVIRPAPRPKIRWGGRARRA